MIGLPTRLLIADRVLGRFAAESPSEAALLEDNREWFMLGALGPALGDFVPHEQPAGFGAPGRTPFYAAWKTVLEIAVGNPSPQPLPDGTVPPPLPGVATTLSTLQRDLDLLTELVVARDFDGIVAFRDSGQLAAVSNASSDLAAILKNFSQLDVLRQLGETIGVRSRPRIDDPINQTAVNTWTGRDYLHWKRTGEFATRLAADAEASGDPRFLAYALGWQVAYAALVCGSGFVASIAGSVYRSHWWRTRWIANFVDTWVWGYYRQDPASFSDDAYESWPSLCGAQLHQWVEVETGLDPLAAAAAAVADAPLPAALPPEFADYWVGAWTATYGPSDPTALPGGDPLFSPDRIQVGYLMTWLVLWFQTSGEVIGCNPPPLAPPPGCGANPRPPEWIDPTKTNPDTGEPFTPPQPHPHHEANVGEVVCGAILGLLGAALTFFGGGAVGLPLLVGGIELAIDGEKQLNWEELECEFFWLGVYMFNGLGALHKLTVLGGFQQPYAGELAAATESISFGSSLPVSFPTAAQSNCRSRGLRGPLQPWNGALLDWKSAPTQPVEAPGEPIWEGEWWPSAIVDDDAANPVGFWLAQAPPSFDSGVDGSFGPAVHNALRLLHDRPAELPNWNLDSDRGHGWLTWELHAPYASPVQAFRET